jgi:hypothetical protein
MEPDEWADVQPHTFPSVKFRSADLLALWPPELQWPTVRTSSAEIHRSPPPNAMAASSASPKGPSKKNGFTLNELGVSGGAA